MELEDEEIEETEMRSYGLNQWKYITREDNNARMSEV
jgi:hypothetical protein